MQGEDKRRLRIRVIAGLGTEPERKTAIQTLKTLQLTTPIEIEDAKEAVPHYGSVPFSSGEDQRSLRECDIVVVLLGNELSAPVEVRGPGGKMYPSGVKIEIEQVLDDQRRSGRPKQVLVYHKTDLPASSGHQTLEAVDRHVRLLEFLSQFEAGGRHPGWVYPVASTDFAEKFARDISTVMSEVMSETTAVVASEAIQDTAKPQTPPGRIDTSPHGTAATQDLRIAKCRTIMSSPLSPAQIRQAQQVLVAAFSREKLFQVFYFAFGVHAEDIAKPGALEDQVFELIDWANRQERIAQLVMAARDANDGNTLLHDFAEQLGLG